MDDTSIPTDHNLLLSQSDALNLLRVVSDAAADFMSAYPGPESSRIVCALEAANRLVRATAAT
jgi:hypothetical protein